MEQFNSNLVKKYAFELKEKKNRNQFSSAQALLGVTVMFSDFNKTSLDGTLFYDTTKHTRAFIAMYNVWHSLIEKSLFTMLA